MSVDRTDTTAADELLWPRYLDPSDLPDIEAVPLADRGLPTSTYGVLQRAAERWPNRRALTVIHDAREFDRAPSWTFAEVAARTGRIAGVLRTAGIGRHDAVGLLSPNVSDLIMSILAAELVGIAAPANPALSPHNLIDLFERGGVRVIVAAGPEVDAAIWSTARSVARAVGVSALYALRPTVRPATAPPLEGLDGIEVRYLDDAVADAEPTIVLPEPAGSDIAAVFHTGGTTGTPKLAAHTHTNEVVNGWMVAANGSIAEDAVLFGALPLFHVNALVVTLLAPLLRGQEVVWAGPLGYRDPEMVSRIWKIVERYRVATLSGVPTVYAALADVPVDADISSLLFGVVGASPLPRAVRERFTSATGVPLMEGYGLTEATCASARGFVHAPRPGSVGQRLPYQLIRAARVDPPTGERHDVPTGTAGSVLISSPSVFAGYVVGHDALGPVLDPLGTIVDGWLDTGDMGRVDQDDFLWLTGRAKDLIIRGGHNIDPALIENALLEHPDVSGVNAVGRPDLHAGEVPVAYVTVHDGSSVTTEELVAFARTVVPEPAAAPRDVVIMAALPVTAVGKANKLPLRADAAAGAARQALREAGIEASVVAQHTDDGLLVEVRADGRGAAVADVLDRFGFQWRLLDATAVEA